MVRAFLMFIWSRYFLIASWRKWSGYGTDLSCLITGFVPSVAGFITPGAGFETPVPRSITP
ncbi:hypothetical protein SK128_009067, partial [Halocaridina rubra]